MSETNQTPDVEMLHRLLEGFAGLKQNPCFVQLEHQITKKREQTMAILVTGEFPPSSRDGATGGDLQGILYREQLIGEVRGLSEMSVTLNAIVQGLADKVKELQAPQENQVQDETV
jgi:hypothetical protein